MDNAFCFRIRYRNTQIVTILLDFFPVYQTYKSFLFSCRIYRYFVITRAEFNNDGYEEEEKQTTTLLR